MKTENIPLNEDELGRIAQIDETIRRRSMDLATASLKMRALQDQLAGVYEARNKFLDDKIKATDLDYSKVRSVGVAPDGQNPNMAVIVVQMDDTEEKPEANPSPESDPPS